MKKYTQSDTMYHLQYCLKNKIEDCFYGVWEQSSIHYGEDKDFNKDVAYERLLNQYKVRRSGGAIVAQPGDVCCVFLNNDSSDFMSQLKLFIKQKLEERNIKITTDKNDLLIDDKKFFGDIREKFGNFYFYGCHISLSVDLETIQKVCLKPMEKVPVGLSEYGISTQDVENWLNEFWFKYKK